MINTTSHVAASIELARLNLDRALTELEQIPVSNPTTLGLGVHALNNYLNITEVTAELLQLSLRDYPNPEVRTWLEGLRHMTDVMHHTVGRLLHASAPGDFPLKFELVNVSAIMRRACDYHRRIAERQQVSVTLQSVGEVLPAWADKIAVAVVADNLLSNAVGVSREAQAVQVQIMSEPGYVLCSVRDHGPGISRRDQENLFRIDRLPGPEVEDSSRGFGLLLAWDFMDRMRGSLQCESEPGRGACFTFRVPVGP
jgi:signal transduction histidine kinase